MIYAEVIGDPIAQSRSPAIHKAWLAACGLEGDYRATQVRSADLATYFATRRGDPDWRGCNVTIPHKQAVMALLDRIDPAAQTIGAVNCVVREGGSLIGRNSDIDGVAAAIADVPLAGGKAAMIGAGGAARAALKHLLDAGAGQIAILVRDPVKAEDFARAAPTGRVDLWPLARAPEALAGAVVIINASPMGMAGAPPMPADLIGAIAANAAGATLFDMVYKPLETKFLEAARSAGGRPVDGLTMLIGQARPAFESFFGTAPPSDDAAVRALLTT